LRIWKINNKKKIDQKNPNQKVCQTFYSMFIHVHDGVHTHAGLDLGGKGGSRRSDKKNYSFAKRTYNFNEVLQMI
jgi:hypothetical protein